MLRGEFRFANGLIVPNNVTKAGVHSILAAALRADAIQFWIGLCSAVYTPDLRIEDITEPTLAAHGYARLAVARSIVGWPGDGLVNDESYFETLPLTWTATAGEAFDQAVTRMFICGTQSGVTGDVFALSAALPDDLIIDSAMDVVDRTFKYRLYSR